MPFALPRPRLLGASLALGLTAILFGCGPADEPGSSAPVAPSAGGGGGGKADGVGPAGQSPQDERCTAQLRWLQKDAYKSTAGRSSDLWPPHTTTTLDVYCAQDGGDPVRVGGAFRENHGTKPEQRDANGDVILVEIKREEATGSRAELLDLVAAYEACDCDGATQFLSLDSLKDEAVQKVLEDVLGYLDQNLICEGEVSTHDIVEALGRGDIAFVTSGLGSCRFADGADLAEGLDEALSFLIESTTQTLADYHVCNNDASLQTDLFRRFVGERAVVACDPTSELCHGPRWFYTP
jgi:hypothetical protein